MTIASVGGTAAAAFSAVVVGEVKFGAVELVVVEFVEGGFKWKGRRPLRFFRMMRSVTDKPSARASSA